MKANETNFLEFLRKSTQFVVPIYQRTYSWKERECRQLWDDIIRTGSKGSKDAIAAHFVSAPSSTSKRGSLRSPATRRCSSSMVSSASRP